MPLIRRLSIQSRLVVLLLTVSIGSILAVGSVAYTSATESLTERMVQRLDSLRRARAMRLRDRMELIRNQVITLAETESIVQATNEFRQAFARLHNASPGPDQVEALRAYYKREFLPELKRNVDGEPILESYFPTRPASLYLQYHYIAANRNKCGERENLDAACDPSDYTKAHRKHHPFFRRFAERFGFQDVLLINPDSGDVLYTSEKTIELGRNLYTGAFSQSNLANLARSLKKQGDRRTFRIADFEPYAPNMGQPAAFVACPVFDGPRRVGVLVLQFPVEKINRIVSGNNGWERDGLGQSGEVYVVGDDHLLRTMTRGMTEDADAYCDALRQAGYSPTVVERIRHLGSPILQQEVRTKAIEKALLGEKGTELMPDYLGGKALTSYGPLPIDGLHWVIVAKIDAASAFEPSYLLGRRILLALVVVAIVVSVLAVWLARGYVRPIHRIGDAVRAVGDGRTCVKVEIDTQDEFGELADAFNSMTESLASKKQQLELTLRANEELLLNILPGPAAARLREGEPQIADTYSDVTVLYAELTGFSELDGQMPAGEAIGMLNDLIGAFDEQAERKGVEKIRTMGRTYLAACGLSVARVDHANRVVEFAQEMLRVLVRFNHDRGAALGLRIGVHSGPAVGGVIGRSKFIYELWGATVNVARGLSSQGEPDTIQISPTVQERLRDLYEFERRPEIQAPGQGRLAAWAIKSAA
jgi:class 3 adenylate cyclase